MPNGWLPGNQLYNFNALIKLSDMAGVSLKNASVLDVGCGTGDFSAFLRKKGIKSYAGIDIYEPSLKEAKDMYPNELFIQGDLLEDVIKETFDFAFSSGTFTIKISADNYDFLQAMVEKMWQMTRVGLAFNVLTDDDRDPDTDLFFYNPSEVLARCMDVAPEAVIGAEVTPHVSQIHVYMYRDLHSLKS